MSRLLTLVPALPLILLFGCGTETPAAPDLGLASEVVEAPPAHANPGPAEDRGLVRSTWPTAGDPGMPFYSRLEPTPPHAYSDGGWTAVPFYREPHCVPADFNLLAFFDPPAAFGCPHTVEGHSLWHGGVGNGAPRLVVARASGPVSVWFVPFASLAPLLQDGIVTIEALEALPGLVRGVAHAFQETHNPHALPPELGGGGHPVPKLMLDTRGVLEDGRNFSLHINTVESGIRNVRIRIR